MSSATRSSPRTSYHTKPQFDTIYGYECAPGRARLPKDVRHPHRGRVIRGGAGNFRAEVGGGVSPVHCKVVFEDIFGFPGDHEPVRESARGLPLYPAKATLAALTASRWQADSAFASLVGSVTFVPGEPELYFEAMDSGAPEEGTMPRPPWA
jgi:hypothetical protein